MPSPSPDLRILLAQQIARIAVLGCYPNLPADHNRQIAWVEAMADDLADIPVDEVAEAFVAYRKSSDPADRFLPTPGRILALTAGHVRAMQAKERATERWETALRLLGSIGVEAMTPERLWQRWPVADVLGDAERTAVLAGVQAAGGWGVLGRHGNVGVLRPTFARGYEAVFNTAKRIERPQLTAAEPRRLA